MKRVGYAYSPELIASADTLPSNEGRAARTHTLIEALGLLESQTVQVINSSSASTRDLVKYHDRDFVSFMMNAEHCDEDDPKLTQYGLEYDCPVFTGMTTYISLVAGASLACADALINSEVDVAINWNGGRHHCKRARAAGFCYVNDIALSIMRLRTKYERVMYIDIDLHHGDGVEAAFASSNKVFTASIHRFENGFYPGTGEVEFTGKGLGTGYTRNLHGPHGLTDEQFLELFSIIEHDYSDFCPEALVVVVGCDGLAKDEHCEWKLTRFGLDSVVQKIIDWHKPTILLGGGGYNHTETAKAWAYITAGVAGVSRDWTDIPDHDYYDDYAGNGFQFE